MTERITGTSTAQLDEPVTTSIVTVSNLCFLFLDRFFAAWIWMDLAPAFSSGCLSLHPQFLLFFFLRHSGLGF